jgi:arylsulfatase A-like enzyme
MVWLMMRPNILLIHADQHRYDCVGANGHPLLQTPNLDRIAREGVNFVQAYCSIPVCTPARASLLTGLWSCQHGCIANPDSEAFRPMLPGLPTFVQTLKAAEYFTGVVGKWGVDRNAGPLEYGFDSYIAEQGYAGWRAAHGLPPPPRRNGYFGEVDPFITPEQSRLAWGAQQTIDMLRTAAADERPFFIRWDPSEPHLPNIPPEPYASLYPPGTIPPWRSFPDPLEAKPFVQRRHRAIWGVEGWTWQQWAPVVSRYLGEITLLDHQVGHILDELDRLGLSRNTLVVYSADHGDLCGGHGLIDKHFVMYDELVRVPLLMRWPDRLPAGCEVDAFVSSSIDLASTFCAAAGQEPPTTFMGHDLLALAVGASAAERESTAGQTHPTMPTTLERTPLRQDIFSAYHGNQLGLFSQRMVRDRRWKYVWNATAEDELYDLHSDPGEITNRAADPECVEELARLRSRLLVWMEQTEDRLLNQWTRRQLAST